jgi:hypothetical protein
METIRMVWTRAATLSVIIALAAVAAALVTIRSPAVASADVCADAGANIPLPLEAGPCADVLAQEARWLRAITAGDRETVEQILGPNFKHVNAEGQFFDRAHEVAGTKKLFFTMNPSEQMVDIAGDTALIHGVNTLMQDGKVLARERFTDVFVLQNGAWMALSAHETAI